MVDEFTFVERVVIEIYVYLWFLQRAWQTDRFEHVKWRRLKNLELKSIITLSILVLMPIQGIFDGIWTILRYQEGLSPVMGNNLLIDETYSYSQLQNYTWIPKPYDLWTHTNYRLKNITEYLLSICFALQTGTLFIMQLFWNHLADQWNARSFMVSTEFKAYIIWTLFSIISFPFSRWITKNIFPYTEVVPQMLFSAELIIICLMGLWNQQKLFSLLQSQELQESTNQEATLQINYFIDMNMLLTGGSLLISISFLILDIDALTKKKIINNSKLASDFIMIHCNLGSLVLWIIMILIIYPRYYMTGLNGSKFLSKRSLGRISRIPSSYSGIYSDHTSGLTVIGGSSLGDDGIRHSTCENGHTMSSKNCKGATSLPTEQQSEIFKYKTTSSIASSVNTLVLDGTNSSNSPLITRSPISSLWNSASPTYSLSSNLQRPTSPPRKLTPSPKISSTSLTELFLNSRNSSPLPRRSSMHSLSPSVRLRTPLPTFSPIHKCTLPMCDGRTSDSGSNYTGGGDDDISRKSYIEDSCDSKQSNYSDDHDGGENSQHQLARETSRQKSPVLKFQSTSPHRPKNHPRDYISVNSWI